MTTYINYHPTNYHYASRESARAAARRLFKKTSGLMDVHGVTRKWNMDCVVVYPESRAWTMFIRFAVKED
jgi:hypothetical protein